MSAETLVKAWIEDARELGRQHGSGVMDETSPLDVINLQAHADETGTGISWGELAEIQNAVTTAYEEGVSEVVE